MRTCDCDSEAPPLAGFCLSGCFSKPLAVVWGNASAAVSQDFARIPIEVCQRRSLPTVFGRLPLAGWLRVSAMAGTSVPMNWNPNVGNVPVVAPGFADSGDNPAITRKPLTVWFWAAYLMTTDKRGVSALLLQRQLALPRYETAWMMLHKFRRAMINLAREPLRGEVEVDDT